ncbi:MULTISPECIES: dihydroxyacetone kinase subunit DhaL [Clostridium]|jgi:dihydroxyacetone kinase-like protein|uniref:phosphoenolpyruvate--glycerone phosphotransferase n=2 Tax=Clostridium TaxID=1485 RepID=A0A151ANL1_9CLOT|nr:MULTISPECIES: dihydroxyacetone kinase subunit DhaL [Clostridium]KYH29213.1 PTS-dependent dihydroxyacetone kinase, ADP-binding subunit DhaL [Clostridium colicanis DSM 13634]MBE6042909.1 dihydroxyacetone kinase subunit L [Clostridium thermopalmarium]PRR71072.1 PTS-dependent dihydroxyacetone kinase, ADP-binding subunit DhaL [Clostridium thermopalmarium DSM 5974]PVZ23589.1 dihydroxyacetone kinase DhaL subunit [Clostridium thermopalmarium DSM 5974]
MSVNGLRVIEIINKIGEVIEKNKLFLTELDAAIGDGDHGLNMSKGFNAVKEKLKDDNGNNIGNILKKTGMALVSNVGGASGPLYGTAFMKAAMVVNGKSEIDIKDFEKMLEAALDGIKMRGKAELNDKTMIDAIEPALNSLRSSIEKGLCPKEALKEAVDAAYKGVEHTKEIAARKGRASYLGERSIGHQDAGATSSTLILETIYKEIQG